MAVSEVLHPEASKRAFPRSVRVCKFWQQGRCSKGPDCGYAHDEPGIPNRKRAAAAVAADPSSSAAAAARPVLKKNTWTNQDLAKMKARAARFESGEIDADKNKKIITEAVSAPKISSSSSSDQGFVAAAKERVSNGVLPGSSTKACWDWLGGYCRFGDRCKYLHTDSTVSGLSRITTLKEAEGFVTGIAMVPEPAVLFTAIDGKLKAWDCNSGTVSDTLAMEGAVKAVAAGSGWIFAGVGCEVRAWSINSSSQQPMQARAAAEINVLVCAADLLVAGLISGEVCAWSVGGGEMKPIGTWSRHPGAVTAVTVVRGRIYSGSSDGSIRVCEAATGRSCGGVAAHGGEITGLVCWSTFLISCSLDGSIKVWAATPDGNLENYFTYPEVGAGGGRRRGGVTGMCGTLDADGKPLLACSYSDSAAAAVRVYDLPTFEERGCLFSRAEVSSLVARDNLVFAGDRTGAVRVWRWSKAPTL